jgi:hypothetical protein
VCVCVCVQQQKIFDACHLYALNSEVIDE